jgi:hypothetical protein
VRKMRVMLAAIAIAFTVPRAAVAWTLLTDEELARDRAASHADRSPAGAAAPLVERGAPVIEIEQPDETKPVRSPVTIRLRFLPQEKSMIDLASFKATYDGWIAIDITNRIVEHANLSESGLFADNADIPSGHYKVTLQIADTLHRVGTRTFEFTVL